MTNLPKNIKPAHCAASRMLGYCLTQGTEAAWREFSIVACARLSFQERADIAWGLLMSLDPDQFEKVCNSVVGSVGMPQAAFLSEMDQASFWADMAFDGELRAYAMARANCLSASDRTALLMHLHLRKDG